MPYRGYRSRRRIHIETRTKIELSPALIRRVSGLDDLARIFFPDNPRHKRAFISLWLEVKYSDGQFLSSCKHIPARYDITQRILEIVRAKMKRLGLIRRVSHYSPEFGHRSGWTFSPRFRSALQQMSSLIQDATVSTGDSRDERKDRDALLYV